MHFSVQIFSARRILSLLFLFHSASLFAQVLDFENLKDKKAGDKVSKFQIGEDCEIEFFAGYNLKEKQSFYLQKVGVQAIATFQGPRKAIDCEGNTVESNRFNNMNSNPYQKNNSYTNKERVGCHFISAILKGNNMPSVFIKYENGINSCSGDVLDVDGANNAIEAYEIFYYENVADYPNNPINSKPISIRTSGKSFGNGEIGDDGGIEHFEINSLQKFTLIEIRPNQKPAKQNKTRTIFGFALDNFSACTSETEPFTPPYLINNEVPKEIPVKETEKVIKPAPPKEVIEDIYFDFDESNIKSSERDKLDNLIAIWMKDKNREIILTAYTDPVGSSQYNISLSNRRVDATRDYLIQHGVSEDQIKTFFKGEQYNENLNDPDWKKRKVHVELN